MATKLILCGSKCPTAFNVAYRSGKRKGQLRKIAINCNRPLGHPDLCSYSKPNQARLIEWINPNASTQDHHDYYNQTCSGKDYYNQTCSGKESNNRQEDKYKLNNQYGAKALDWQGEHYYPAY